MHIPKNLLKIIVQKVKLKKGTLERFLDFMKKEITVLFCLMVMLLQAQTQVHLKDKETKMPVAYANIWKAESLYRTADSTGVFSVDTNDKSDFFKITCVGYHDTIAQISSEIWLRPNKIALDEIRLVKRKFEKTAKLGKAKRGDNHYGVQWDTKMAMTAKYFSNNGIKGTYLSKAKFFATATAKNRLISVLVYSVGNDGKPDEILNTETLIYKLKKGTHAVEADLNSLNIEFPPNGIFIIIQHPLLEQNKSYSKENSHPNGFFYEPLIAIDESTEYIDSWYFKDGDWHQQEKYTINAALQLTDWLHFDVKRLSQSNIIIGILMTRGFDDEFIDRKIGFFDKGKSE